MVESRDKRRGWLFVFEGIDGSGKTTQVRRTAETLRARGLRVLELAEPTTGRYGQQIRLFAQTLSRQRQRITQEQVKQLLELFVRDRMENVAENIRPALERGEIILLDRYYFSTMAYQGARGIDPEEIRRRNEEFAPPPDLVLYFKLPVEEAWRRIKREVDATPDLFETHTDEEDKGAAPMISRSVKIFERRDELRRVKAIYDDLSRRRPEFCTIDARADEDEVASKVLEAIESCMAKGRRTASGKWS